MDFFSVSVFDENHTKLPKSKPQLWQRYEKSLVFPPNSLHRSYAHEWFATIDTRFDEKINTIAKIKSTYIDTDDIKSFKNLFLSHHTNNRPIVSAFQQITDLKNRRSTSGERHNNTTSLLLLSERCYFSCIIIFFQQIIIHSHERGFFLGTRNYFFFIYIFLAIFGIWKNAKLTQKMSFLNLTHSIVGVNMNEN